MTITGEQVARARRLLGLSRIDLDAVSRRGNEWLAVTEGSKSLGYFADKALAVKAVLDTPAPREKKRRRP